MIYFDSDRSKSTNTVVYFDWKTVIYIYVYGKCRTQFMLPMEKYSFPTFLLFSPFRLVRSNTWVQWKHLTPESSIDLCLQTFLKLLLRLVPKVTTHSLYPECIANLKLPIETCRSPFLVVCKHYRKLEEPPCAYSANNHRWLALSFREQLTRFYHKESSYYVHCMFVFHIVNHCNCYAPCGSLIGQ
jgi:hypothetical protein